MHTYMHTCIHTCIHTYIHTHMDQKDKSKPSPLQWPSKFVCVVHLPVPVFRESQPPPKIRSTTCPSLYLILYIVRVPFWWNALVLRAVWWNICMFFVFFPKYPRGTRWNTLSGGFCCKKYSPNAYFCDCFARRCSTCVWWDF